MQVELSEQEVNYLIGACDVVVRAQGLNAAGAALSVAAKLQAALQPQPEAPQEG